MTDETEKILNKWFDMKYHTYDKLEQDGSIYLYYNGEEYADIRVDKKDRKIFYKWDLYWEFCEIIPIEHVEFRQVMTKWVEDTFNFKGFTPIPDNWSGDLPLKIPK